MNKFDFDRSLLSVGTIVEINYLTDPENNIYAINEIEVNERASILWSKQGVAFRSLEVRVSIQLERVPTIEFFDADVNVGWILPKEVSDTINISGQEFFIRSVQRMNNEYSIELVPIFSI